MLHLFEEFHIFITLKNFKVPHESQEQKTSFGDIFLKILIIHQKTWVDEEAIFISILNLKIVRNKHVATSSNVYQLPPYFFIFYRKHLYMYAIIANFSSSKLTTLWYATDSFLKHKKDNTYQYQIQQGRLW